MGRRLLKKIGLEKIYKGNQNISGKYFLNERKEINNQHVSNPFCSYLDVGLRRTTTGSRIYAVMKGGTDGGLYIPHNESGKQFPGWSKKDGEILFKPEICKNY